MSSLRSSQALNQVISADPRLMFHKIVKKTVAECFVDDAISVREAAVTLVGSYVLKSPKVAYAYHASLLDRLNDKGVSVRKSVVKIFRDVLLTQPLYPQRTETCYKLVQQFADPKEEESIKDFVYDIFMRLWFSQDGSDDKKGVKGKEIEGAEDWVGKTPQSKTSKIATITPGTGSSEVATGLGGLFSPAALQIIEVVAISKDTSFLSKLVQDLLFSLGEGENATKAQQREKVRHRESRGNDL